MDKQILVVDFDGVLHRYDSGWQGADVIPDPPVDGAMQFLYRAVAYWRVNILSSRSHHAGGITAMQQWLLYQLIDHFEGSRRKATLLYDEIEWPTVKPPAQVTLDDRAITFSGYFPDPKELLKFQPWTKERFTVGKGVT